MAIQWQVLGEPGEDNALLVTVVSGQRNDALLFDCGEGVLDGLAIHQIREIDHLCFSHYHMDHVGGFDRFFRHQFHRPGPAVHVWGPEDTLEILSARFRGYTWNLHQGLPGEWHVHAIRERETKSARFLTREAFTLPRDETTSPRDPSGLLHREPTYRLEATLLPHGTISSVAYRVVENDKRNISPRALEETGLAPGPWLQEVLNSARPDDAMVDTPAGPRPLGPLRRELLCETPGDSIAYLTDFHIEPDTPEWQHITRWLKGTGTLVCECQYREADSDLAVANGHMTATTVARLARDANVGRLVLLHLSRRYRPDQWLEMVAAARVVFPGTEIPPGWNLPDERVTPTA